VYVLLVGVCFGAFVLTCRRKSRRLARGMTERSSGPPSPGVTPAATRSFPHAPLPPGVGVGGLQGCLAHKNVTPSATRSFSQAPLPPSSGVGFYFVYRGTSLIRNRPPPGPPGGSPRPRSRLSQGLGCGVKMMQFHYLYAHICPSTERAQFRHGQLIGMEDSSRCHVWRHPLVSPRPAPACFRGSEEGSYARLIDGCITQL